MSDNKNHPEATDPLKKLSKKALRKLARKLKIKNYQRKSPSSLRRAIQRAQGPIAPIERVTAIESDETVIEIPALPAPKEEPKVLPKPLTPYEKQTQQREEALKAYQENRLRYLFMPSKFSKTGVNDEFLLEEEDIDLPDIYEEEELVALPVDPTQFYVYWDFSPDTLKHIKAGLAKEAQFVLRTHDITNISFDGANAWRFWDTPCQPLVREWYINTPLNDRDICCELGIIENKRFRMILRANSLYIPPETLSDIRHDVFAQFVPLEEASQLEATQDSSKELRKPDILPTAKDQPDQIFRPMTAPQKPLQSIDFFQTYIPNGPQIVPDLSVLEKASAQDFDLAPDFPVQLQENKAGFSQSDFQETQIGAGTPWTLPALEPVRVPQEGLQHGPQAEWEQDIQWVPRKETIAPQHSFLEEKGQTLLKTWLGDPTRTEIRWLSEMPNELMPIIFEEWVTDPHDQAVFVSYSVLPWEWTEHLPLGSSDRTQRRFLGASVTSWHTPGGSERLVTWKRKPTGGGSEEVQWRRPLGASEQPWSARTPLGSSAPLGGSERMVLWPTHQSGRSNFRRRDTQNV